MLDQILKCLCILSFITFLFKRLPLLINKKMLYLLLGCFILYILYSVYKKWKEEKKIIRIEKISEEIPISIEKIFESFEAKLEKRFESFETKLEERIINILQEIPKRKRKN
jgi:hypothetical protein